LIAIILVDEVVEAQRMWIEQMKNEKKDGDDHTKDLLPPSASDDESSYYSEDEPELDKFGNYITKNKNDNEILSSDYSEEEDEQEEESLVFESDTVVGENAVVAHLEDALVAYGAMVSSSRLKVIALVAFTIPEASEISYCFRAVFHQSLDVLL